MTDDEIYKLDEVLCPGIEQERRDARLLQAQLDFIRDTENDMQDEAMNELVTGWEDRRGRQLDGFEFVRSAGAAPSRSELDAIIEDRKRIEFAAAYRDDPAMVERVLLKTGTC